MGRSVGRRAFLAAVGVATLAGCSGSRQTDGAGTSTPEPTETVESITARNSPGGVGPPTLTDSLPLSLEPPDIRDRAVSGGPPKDGIPSIDDPSFVTAERGMDMLAPGDPVFGLATADGVKAYPQSILVWHEICNDEIGKTPVSVTYCPLTGTAMGFLRGQTTFGVSGRLVNNNLIMFDRATETWWPQVLATAVPGPWNERPQIRSLREFRLVWTTWERWRSAYPETRVLSRDTGHARNYDRDPYGSYNPPGGYYSPEAAPMFPSLSEDDRLPPKQVVIGARTPAGAVAFEKDRLRKTKLLEGELADEPIVAVHDQALNTGYVYVTPEGASFEVRDGQVIDDEGATHQPDELPADRLLAFDAMWFAWSGFYPDTALYA